jgi:dolichol-phosphate mannosyltransferase
MSIAAALASRVMLGISQKDVTSGFRCYRKDVIARMVEHPFMSRGYAFQEESLFRCARMGATIEEVPITFVERRKGRSKLRWRDVTELFSVLMRLRVERKVK